MVCNAKLAGHLRAERRQWTGGLPDGTLRFGDEKVSALVASSSAAASFKLKPFLFFFLPNPTRYPCPPFRFRSRIRGATSRARVSEGAEKDQRGFPLRATAASFDWFSSSLREPERTIDERSFSLENCDALLRTRAARSCVLAPQLFFRKKNVFLSLFFFFFFYTSTPLSGGLWSIGGR